MAVCLRVSPAMRHLLGPLCPSLPAAHWLCSLLSTGCAMAHLTLGQPSLSTQLFTKRSLWELHPFPCPLFLQHHDLILQALPPWIRDIDHKWGELWVSSSGAGRRWECKINCRGTLKTDLSVNVRLLLIV